MKNCYSHFGLAAALTLPAQDFKITHGPWLCDMTEDGVTVLWTTNKPALSWVEATEDDGRSFYAAEHTRHYETVAGRKQAHKTLHAVRLNNLRPERNTATASSRRRYSNGNTETTSSTAGPLPAMSTNAHRSGSGHSRQREPTVRSSS